MFNTDSDFNLDEEIGRGIPKIGFWDSHCNRPTSSVFSNCKSGCSVDRQGDRTETELVEQLLKNHKECDKIAIIKYEDIVATDCSIIPDPVTNNPYHCNLFDGNGFDYIKRSKGRKLAELCHIV